MARPVTVAPDRAAQTVRMPQELKDRLDDLARADRRSVNDYIVEALQQHADARAGVDRQVHEVASAAIGLATMIVTNIERRAGRPLDSDARLMAIEAALTFSITNSVRQMMQPPKEMAGVITLYSMVLGDAEKFDLSGPVWDYIRSLGPNSPPPTEEQVAALSNEIVKLQSGGLSGDKLEAVKSLDRWLGLAVYEHQDTWSDFQRHREEQRQVAKTELYELLTNRSAKKKAKK